MATPLRREQKLGGASADNTTRTRPKRAYAPVSLFPAMTVDIASRLRHGRLRSRSVSPVAIAPKDADYSLEAQLDEFRETIAPDVYSVSTFVPWAEIEAQVSAVAQPIAALQTLVDNDGFTKSRLTPALEDEPGIAEIARHLFTAPHAVGFSDGRELPERFNPAVHDACRVASLLLDLGLARLLPPGSPVAELYRIAVVAVDARRRGFRRRADLETRVNFLMDEALSTVGARAGAELKRIPPVEQPQEARGRGVEVIAADGRPVAAVATVFQASSGGRQSRDLSVTYPRLQEDLDGVPVSLLVIADGRGVLDASRRVLATLFESVAACMTLAQAEPSGLADALETAVAQRGVRTARRASLRTIIDTRLGHEVGVNASDLPAPRETAEAALAQYVADHDELALTLSRDGQRLEWTRTDAVGAAQALTEAYSAQQAVALLASALGLTDVADVPIADSGLVMTVGETRADPVLPPKLVVASTEAEVDEELAPILHEATAPRGFRGAVSSA